ncbi:7985_t:CDS:2, partial [Acaulospora morrowiae]
GIQTIDPGNGITLHFFRKSRASRIRRSISVLQHLREFHTPKPIRASEHPTPNRIKRRHTTEPLVVTSPRGFFAEEVFRDTTKRITPEEAAVREIEKMKSNERVVLNVGGQKFETYRSTLTAYPNTLLGKIFSEEQENILSEVEEIFFDRDYNVFKYIMQFYRNGRITWPSSPTEPSVDDIYRELAFFKIELRKGHAQIIEAATFRVDSFIDMILEAIFEARVDFKKKLEITFYRSGDLPAKVSPAIPVIERLVTEYSHIGYGIIDARNYKLARFVTCHPEVAQGGLRFEIVHEPGPPSSYRIIVEAYQLIQPQAMHNSALTFQDVKKQKDMQQFRRNIFFFYDDKENGNI